MLDFKGRHREVMGRGYTELFFLDEVTAFAAGHRPCFECRRKDALAFANGWAIPRPTAPHMDAVLHAQRLDGRAKRLHRLSIDELPDGTMIALDSAAFAIRGDALLPWSATGYASPLARPRGILAFVLTPPAIVNVLRAGYRPGWHPVAAAN